MSESSSRLALFEAVVSALSEEAARLQAAHSLGGSVVVYHEALAEALRETNALVIPRDFDVQSSQEREGAMPHENDDEYEKFLESLKHTKLTLCSPEEMGRRREMELQELLKQVDKTLSEARPS
jgi:hypothetical protein